tara:strand:- start:272 stop:553 length:282 start_codon:yes stop_codon:yes gene_type:complete
MNISVIDMIHDFYLIKGHIHYHDNIDIIDSYNNKPGLVNIAKKHKIAVEQVYNIMREYRLNQLNKNVIIAKKGTYNVSTTRTTTKISRPKDYF